MNVLSVFRLVIILKVNKTVIKESQNPTDYQKLNCNLKLGTQTTSTSTMRDNAEAYFSEHCISVKYLLTYLWNC